MRLHDTTPRSFLLLHGWQNRRPEGHWQRLLAGELTALGHRVSYPQLPDPDRPDLNRWLAELRRELDGLDSPDGPGGPNSTEKVVICHSLACLLWLHAVARHAPGEITVDRVLLVAPPSRSVVSGFEEIAAFAPPPVTADRLATASRARTRLVAGDDDPYCPEGALAIYGLLLGLDTDVIPGGGHLDLAAGYGPWPSLLHWCLDAGARIEATGA